MSSALDTILTLAVVERFLPGAGAGRDRNDLTSLAVPLVLIESLRNGGQSQQQAASSAGSGDQLSSLLTTVIALSFLDPKQPGNDRE